MKTLGALILFAGLGSGTALGDVYTCDIPQELAAKAKLTQWQALAAAQKAVPEGQVDKVELEQEKGALVYHVDLTTLDQGMAQVTVDAMSGRVMSVSLHTPSP